MQAKLSICVTVKNRSRVKTEYGTLELFPALVDSLLAALQPGEAELVVVDWDSTDWPLEQWLGVRSDWLPVQLVTIRQPGFSRGLGLNVAAEHATSDVLCFVDTDMLIPRRLLLQGHEAVEKEAVFAPVCYYFLDHAHRTGFWAEGGYGCCMLTQQMLATVGGWPVYREWGFADTHLMERLALHYPIERPKIEGFIHQWHPPACARARLRGQEGAPLEDIE